MATSTRMRYIARQKLDAVGHPWRQLSPAQRVAPHRGWITAIREALGMSQADLARRLGVRASSVGKLENAERARTVQLDTLQRAADALDCDLVYALVPRRPLQEAVKAPRLELARPLLERTRHHMQLEAQDAPDAASEDTLLREAERLVPDSDLWRVPK